MPRPGRPAAPGGPVLHAGQRRAVGWGRGREAVSPPGVQRSAVYHGWRPRGGRAAFPDRRRRAWNPSPGRARASGRAAVRGPAGTAVPSPTRWPAGVAGRRGGGDRAAGDSPGRVASRRRPGRTRAARLPRSRPRRRGRAASTRASEHRRRDRRPSRIGDRPPGGGARRRRRRARGLRLRPAENARGRQAALRRIRGAGTAGTRVGDGVRLRRLLRVRRADPRRLHPAVRRRSGDRRQPARYRPGRRGGWTGVTLITFCGIELEHPIINASGTFDALAALRVFGEDLIERFPFSAFVTKTVTLEPRAGNPPPRLWEFGAGMINSIGLPNKGLTRFLAEDLPRLSRLPVPLIVNVMGFTREEVAELVAAVGEHEEVVALELNVSCPNVKTGLVMGADPRELGALLARVRPLTDKPLILKLTPNADDVPAVARAAQDAGADAVSLINTLRGMALDPTD